METHIIKRLIPGCELPVGALVDTSLWRNAGALERQRFIDPLVESNEQEESLISQTSENMMAVITETMGNQPLAIKTRRKRRRS